MQVGGVYVIPLNAEGAWRAPATCTSKTPQPIFLPLPAASFKEGKPSPNASISQGNQKRVPKPSAASHGHRNLPREVGHPITGPADRWVPAAMPIFRRRRPLGGVRKRVGGGVRVRPVGGGTCGEGRVGGEGGEGRAVGILGEPRGAEARVRHAHRRAPRGALHLYGHHRSPGAQPPLRPLQEGPL